MKLDCGGELCFRSSNPRQQTGLMESSNGNGRKNPTAQTLFSPFNIGTWGRVGRGTGTMQSNAAGGRRGGECALQQVRDVSSRHRGKRANH